MVCAAPRQCQGASSPMVLEAYHDKCPPKKKKGHALMANDSVMATARGATARCSGGAGPY